mmetsp:Transcript_16884/g.48206  ORF Transcript_16884/g.48206 Transcript_16884/m.48206 type:complete len:177 (+) Transcript_16884:240-770(+)
MSMSIIPGHGMAAPQVMRRAEPIRQRLFVCWTSCCDVAHELGGAGTMAAGNQGNEVDEVIRKVMAIESVSRYVIFNKDGIVLRYEGWPNEDGDGGYRKCVQLAGTVSNLVHHSSQGCQDLLAPPNNEVECLRLKTREYEMIIAPAPSFTMVAIQDNTRPRKEASGSSYGEGAKDSK